MATRSAQLSVVVTMAHHHSAGPGVVTRREEQQEEVEFETDAGLRAQIAPPPRSRPPLLSEVAGPQAAVTVGYVAAGPPSVVVVPVAVHNLVDRATVQFLLQQPFLARAAEKEKVREEAEVKMLEDDVADKESQLLEALWKVRDASARPSWREGRRRRRRRGGGDGRVGHGVLLSCEKYWV